MVLVLVKVLIFFLELFLVLLEIKFVQEYCWGIVIQKFMFKGKYSII